MIFFLKIFLVILTLIITDISIKIKKNYNHEKNLFVKSFIIIIQPTPNVADKNIQI